MSILGGVYRCGSSLCYEALVLPLLHVAVSSFVLLEESLDLSESRQEGCF